MGRNCRQIDRHGPTTVKVAKTKCVSGSDGLSKVRSDGVDALGRMHGFRQ